MAKRRSGSATPSASDAPFYIPAVDAPARPRSNLKHNDTFAIFDSHGDIGASTGGEDGLFHCDTRHLSHLECLINGSRPLLLHSTINDDNNNYYVDLTNPDIYEDGRLILPKDTIHISRTIYLLEGSLRERICLVNHGPEVVNVTFSLLFASDFADIFEVRGIRRERRGRSRQLVPNAATVQLIYEGLDDILRQTTVSFQPQPTLLQSSVASYRMTLEPMDRNALFVIASSEDPFGEATSSFFRGLFLLKRESKSRTNQSATIDTANVLVGEVLARSTADLDMLTTATEDGPYPYAGIPWYSTTFGRDGIITAMEMLWVDPGIAVGVLKRLARLQATEEDPARDAQPGKILHETRAGEMARTGEVPFGRYYGTVDATPLYVMLAGQYAERTGDWALIRELWPSIERALEWMEKYGDADGDGLIEYDRATPTGLANQGWKDSHDSIFHADGQNAQGPIALVEVQGYAYAARLAAAACARGLEMPDRATALTQAAEWTRQRFEAAFWCEDIGFYALALDGDKCPCKVRTTNPGHALATGIASTERGAAVATALLGADFHSGWGIRTVASGEALYNPMSYHNGSIWPHDNAIVADGLARYGKKHAVIDLFEGLIRATTYLEQRRIPELYCGFRRRPGRGPVLYPAACSPQAWAAAAPLSLIRSMLGLRFLPATRELRLENPIVSPMAGAITLRNVQLAGASADFTVRPSVGGVALEVLRTSGDIRISLSVDHCP